VFAECAPPTVCRDHRSPVSHNAELDCATEDGRAWTPARVADALDGGGEQYEMLARALLAVVMRLAAAELHPWASRYRRQPSDLRRDTVQDVMVRLFAEHGRVLRAWEPDLGLTLRGFLKRVVRYHVLTLFRTERGNPWRNESTDPDQLDQLDGEGTGLFNQLWLWRVRDRLLAEESTRGRALYVALFVEQRSADDIAAGHDMTRDAVYQWRARFKRRAAKLLSAPARRPPERRLAE